MRVCVRIVVHERLGPRVGFSDRVADKYPQGKLMALAEKNRLEASRPATAPAIVWRNRID